ncbi:MAG: hypothetical protein K0R12_802 [Gammaproteobacteria bacterium]|nr:hypothetical protein [Gammaproteobacteria bacterium]
MVSGVLVLGHAILHYKSKPKKAADTEQVEEGEGALVEVAADELSDREREPLLVNVNDDPAKKNAGASSFSRHCVADHFWSGFQYGAAGFLGITSVPMFAVFTTESARTFLNNWVFIGFAITGSVWANLPQGPFSVFDIPTGMTDFKDTLCNYPQKLSKGKVAIAYITTGTIASMTGGAFYVLALMARDSTQALKKGIDYVTGISLGAVGAAFTISQVFSTGLLISIYTAGTLNNFLDAFFGNYKAAWIHEFKKEKLNGLIERLEEKGAKLSDNLKKNLVKGLYHDVQDNAVIDLAIACARIFTVGSVFALSYNGFFFPAFNYNHIFSYAIPAEAEWFSAIASCVSRAFLLGPAAWDISHAIIHSMVYLCVRARASFSDSTSEELSYVPLSKAEIFRMLPESGLGLLSTLSAMHMLSSAIPCDISMVMNSLISLGSAYPINFLAIRRFDNWLIKKCFPTPEGSNEAIWEEIGEWMNKGSAEVYQKHIKPMEASQANETTEKNGDEQSAGCLNSLATLFGQFTPAANNSPHWKPDDDVEDNEWGFINT